ncbi:hypothetical protein C2G38_506486 [Gigaspora rosea]|uniref:Serine-threonine/tyrosine-protein kinase catalytic domain-containing protein n=1 Tax=Gigaspora rosea TaxID=44941 RepID=A0A397WD47_9GLOM|nr:hypothetical protein C2G38_506486 [Gigaspora rosea]
MNKCLDAEPQNRPTAEELASTLYNFFENLRSEETELCKQIKEIKSSGKNFTIYDMVKLARFNYQTHPQAIYTSCLLHLQKL